jgi:peptidoglycan/xylan/chitin deacetylase (PgdA/CDA1 family)
MKEIKHTILKKTFIADIIIVLLFCSICFVVYHIIISQTKPVVEIPQNEMKKIPADIRKAMEKSTPTPIQSAFGKPPAIASISATIRVPILLYHYVEYVQDKRDKMRQSLNIPPNVFEAQVKTLVDAGYTFMTARNLGDVLDGKAPLPQKPVVLTFDDGHWDFYTDVLPILKQYQVKATAYIIPGFIGGSDFMTQPEVQAVVNSGLVDIGAHTVHHVSLKGKLLPIVQYEVDQSKTMLEQTYNLHVVSFAYPNGYFDQQAVQVVKDAGFTTAVSTIPGIEQNQQNRFFLYRLRPGYRTGQSLLEYLQQSVFQAY